MSGESLEFIEIDIPVCSLSYGVSPCTASIPTTGDAECFNSLATCQDTANIDLADVTWRFGRETAHHPRPEIDIIEACLVGVEYTSAVLAPGESLGSRASLKVTFRDFKHSDAGPGLDKYHADRGYDPYERGRFWSRFRARQPYLRGRALRWIIGKVGDDLADMETRHFFIESFEGPGADGRFSIVAKDALKFLDGDRAQAPVLSEGFLVADINSAVTAATLSPAGIGNSNYPASGYVNIGGNEVCAFTRSGDALTLTRAQFGSVASAHAAQDRVQLCVVYDADSPADIIHSLITTYTDLPSSYITLSEWQDEVDTHLNRNFSAVIAEPTPVAKLVGELMQQAGLNIFDDNINQKLRLQVLRAISANADRYDESNIIRGSFSNTDQPEKRVSRVNIYFGQKDPTKRVDDPDNYRSTEPVVDEDAEANEGAQAIKTIYARWIPALGRTIATRIGQLILGRYVAAPRKFQLGVFRDSVVAAPALGGGYQIGFDHLQDASGLPTDVPGQVVALVPSQAGWNATLEEANFDVPDEDLTNRVITIDFDVNNLNLRTAHDSIYPPVELGQTVTFIIAAGVKVGSTSASVPAIDVGTWDGSPTLNLTVIGRIQGCGGAGGAGVYNFNGGSGVAGGVALYTREAINLTDASGQIWGGGGGGGAGGASGPDGSGTSWYGGGGGGGGAGSAVGAGGGGGHGASISGQAGQPGTTEAGGTGGLSGSPFGGGVAGRGGNGGGPGLSGSAGSQPAAGYVGGNGGAAGAAIDGISFVTTLGSAGDRRGGTIN